MKEWVKLTNKQFARYCEIVYQESGINLTEEKRELLNSRISKRVRKLGINAERYLSMIRKDHQEMKQFLNVISTNHTFFFREAKSFKYLDNAPGEIWCAASSSGEEPYSLAAYCLERGFRPSILATDISTDCIQAARQAVYPLSRSSGIPNLLLKRYFQKGHGRWDGYFRAKPDVRKMIRFERFNLLKDNPSSNRFDMIFCRNVMIYFDNPTKEHVVGKLCSVLKNNGYFIIGGAESLSGLQHKLKYVEPSVYLKP